MLQSMSKWTSRFQLGQSTSIPGVILDPKDVHHIKDEGGVNNIQITAV